MLFQNLNCRITHIFSMTATPLTVRTSAKIASESYQLGFIALNFQGNCSSDVCAWNLNVFIENLKYTFVNYAAYKSYFTEQWCILQQ